MKERLLRVERNGGLYAAVFVCPACGIYHQLKIGGEDGWTFNGDFVRPTFTPSLLVEWCHGEDRLEKRCHSYIRDGRIEFLADSKHALSGQTVELAEVSEEERERWNG